MYAEMPPSPPPTRIINGVQAPLRTPAKAIQIHDPLCSTTLVHSDHIDQIEFLNPRILLTKARAGRDLGNAHHQRTNEEASDLIMWSFTLNAELVLKESTDPGHGLGFDGFEDSHQGAFTLLARFVLPKQGFYGRSFCVTQDGTKVIVPFQGGVWECDLEKVPMKFGLQNRPKQSDEGQWEGLVRAPMRSTGKGIWFASASLTSDEGFLACCGEDGMVVVFKREVAEENKMERISTGKSPTQIDSD